MDRVPGGRVLEGQPWLKNPVECLGCGSLYYSINKRAPTISECDACRTLDMGALLSAVGVPPLYSRITPERHEGFHRAIRAGCAVLFFKPREVLEKGIGRILWEAIAVQKTKRSAHWIGGPTAVSRMMGKTGMNLGSPYLLIIDEPYLGTGEGAFKSISQTLLQRIGNCKPTVVLSSDMRESIHRDLAFLPSTKRMEVR